MSEEKKKETYKIIVDRRPHDWHEPFITGADIKRLAGVDQATFDAWQDVPGPEDVLVADDRKVDLREKGTEKFFTGKKAPEQELCRILR